MEWSLSFVFNSILLGVGLAMDAFSVSFGKWSERAGDAQEKKCVSLQEPLVFFRH